MQDLAHTKIKLEIHMFEIYFPWKIMSFRSTHSWSMPGNWTKWYLFSHCSMFSIVPQAHTGLGPDLQEDLVIPDQIISLHHKSNFEGISANLTCNVAFVVGPWWRTCILHMCRGSLKITKGQSPWLLWTHCPSLPSIPLLELQPVGSRWDRHTLGRSRGERQMVPWCAWASCS